MSDLVSRLRASIFDRPLITGKQIADGLRVTPAWFYSHRPALEERGFPVPVIHKLYDARAVHAWLDGQMDPLLLGRVRA